MRKILQKSRHVLKGSNTPVRLLSCNDLASADELAVLLNRDVIANGGLTRIHADGKVTVVNEAGDLVWY